MPTLWFLVYLLAVGAAYLFRLSYLGWFGPYLLWAVLLLPPLVVLLSLPGMLALRLRLSGPERARQGSASALTISFDTLRFLPVGKVKITLQVENRFAGEVKRFRYSYDSVLSSDGQLPLPTELCGQLVCRVVRAECRDLLGLIALPRRCRGEVCCTVLPRPVEPDNPVNLDALLELPIRMAPKPGGGYAEEHELREYRPGDTVRSIHWKLSSKTDEVIVREPLQPENDRIYLVLERVGAGDRGLESLYWLSLALCRRELPHELVAGELLPVSGEGESDLAMVRLLSSPMTAPVAFPAAAARAVLVIRGGEVSIP